MSRAKLTQDQRKHIGDQYQDDESVVSLALKYAVSTGTVYNVLREYRIPRRHRYTVDELLFDEIDTEAAAYWLGFLFADGWIYRKGYTTQVGLSLNTRDVGHLGKFRDSLSATHPISYSTKRPMARVTVSNPRLVSGLEKHGMTVRKSLTLEYPTTVPADLEHHFIRGYVDGDGCIKITVHHARGGCRQPSITICSSKNMVTTMRDRFRALSGVGFPKIAARGRAYLLAYGGGRQVPILLQYLYGDASIWLNRKYRQAMSVLAEFPTYG